MFVKATKTAAKLRLCVSGPAGSGKTYCALTWGAELARLCGGRMAVLDTERGSASKYADLPPGGFDVAEMSSFSPDAFIKAISEAQKADYSVLVIDSLSSEWSGIDGCLEMVDKVSAGQNRPNSFSAWRDVTPAHNRLLACIAATRMHIICTLRCKVEYALERDERTGKSVVRKLGLAPVQRDGIEHEFDLVVNLDEEHLARVGKTRVSSLDGYVEARPGLQLATMLHGWLAGAPAAPAAPAAPPVPQAGPVLDKSAGSCTKVQRTILRDLFKVMAADEAAVVAEKIRTYYGVHSSLDLSESDVANLLGDTSGRFGESFRALKLAGTIAG